MPQVAIHHGLDGSVQEEIDYEGAEKKSIRLKKDLVIPKGTVFGYTPKSKQYASHQGLIDLHVDSCGTFIIWDELLKLRPDLFEEVCDEDDS